MSPDPNRDTAGTMTSRSPVELESVVIRFAGDSGDGIQVTGGQFTSESAIAGNDIATLPNFPAEIRAPAGSLAGVSGFQIQFGSREVHTPGDQPDVLVCMNPAALRSNLNDLRKKGVLILNEDAFQDKNLARVGYATNPLTDEKIAENYSVFRIPISRLTKEALANTKLSPREVERCKNFFTLGVMLWMFHRPSESTQRWLESKFSKNQDVLEGTKLALQAGLTFGEATEIFDHSYVIRPAKLPPATYRNINGTTALSFGLIAAAQKSGLRMFFGAYPITPASDILHELARHKRLGITTFQAEDEIAAAAASIGAAFAGSLAVTSSSGPGISLKQEALGYAVITELPLVIVNIQRGGPSTGLPTKTEQSDLLQAVYGRHGEAPVCVLAASTPTTAFEMAYEACRIATKYMSPVILLSDGYINNSSEPWAIPDTAKLKDFEITRVASRSPNSDPFLPYDRNPHSLSRPWAIPGTSGAMHRIGGIEKEDLTGNISYDADNHQRMTLLRQEKIKKIQAEIPSTQIFGETKGKLLILGWGGTYGTIRQATIDLQREGFKVSQVHLHHICPFPADLAEILAQFSKILIPEINCGQLRMMIRNEFLVDAQGLNVVRGQPLNVSDVIQSAKSLLLNE